MKHNAAIKVALECMKRVQQRYAIGANLYRAGLITDATILANRNYTRIEQAMAELDTSDKKAENGN